MNRGDSIAAVIPVHNRADLLDRLLTTVKSQSIAFDEVLIIDNESSDGAPGIASNHGCTVLRMGRNAGFAAAVNAGWRKATTRWIAILNSDVELDAHWLERLLESAGSDSFVTGTILNATHRSTVDGTYDLVSRSGCAWRAGNGDPEVLPRSGPARIAIAPATACLFRREVLETLGGFDESFGSYLEDVELGLRCIRQGYQGVYVPSAIAWHHGSATLGRWNPAVVRLISRNQLLLVGRHYDRALFRSCFWSIVVGQILWGLVALRHGAFRAWFAGKCEALRSFALRGAPSDRIRCFLSASELEIGSRSRDWYWRWYFRLTAGAAN